MPPYQKLCFDSKATRAEQSKPGSCGYKQPFSLLHGSTSEVNAYMVAPGWFRMKRWPLSFSPLFLSLLPSFLSVPLWAGALQRGSGARRACRPPTWGGPWVVFAARLSSGSRRRRWTGRLAAGGPRRGPPLWSPLRRATSSSWDVWRPPRKRAAEAPSRGPASAPSAACSVGRALHSSSPLRLLRLHEAPLSSRQVGRLTATRWRSVGLFDVE